MSCGVIQGYTVTEATTGAAVARGRKSRKAVIEYAREILLEKGQAEYEQALVDVLAGGLLCL
jgi:hypothetical protein